MHFLYLSSAQQLTVSISSLQYLNGKAAYVQNIWSVINWKVAEERFLGTREDAFKVLKASI